MRDLQSLIDRNRQSMRRQGYGLFMNTVAGAHCRWIDQMTNDDIAFWNERLDEWEALSESEKDRYDVLCALERL